MKGASYATNDTIEVYTAIVQSVLEYACVLCHPGLTNAQSEYIDNIQTRFLDIAFPNYYYMDALGETDLESLEER